MRSEAATVEEYLSELPEDQRHVVSAVRDVIVANLPAGYEEAMNWGMISYEVPVAEYVRQVGAATSARKSRSKSRSKSE